MQTKPPSSFCAAAAIATALALGSTAVSAQDTAPSVPTVAPPPPAVTAPAAAPPAPAISAPVVQAVPPAAAEPAPAPRAEARTVRAAPAVARQTVRGTPGAAAAPAPASAIVAPAPVAAPAITGPIGAINGAPISAPLPVAIGPAVVTTQAPSSGLTGVEAGLVALLAAGGLAGAGFMLMRSRRKPEDKDDDVDAAGTAPVPFVTTPAMQVAAPAGVSAPEPERSAQPSFALPTVAVPTGAEREAVLERMVAAAPDEANPFTSRKSRRKRARLILQHREHLQRNPAAEPFDWRTYRRSATAETAATDERLPHPA
jgi:hypothetical protein